MVLLFLMVTNVQAVFGQQHSEHKHTDHSQHQSQEITHPKLNQGAKWVMDDHTRVMFIAMKQKVDTGGDLQAMGAELNDDLQKLIQGCTMTGAAHDQLHVFLVPYMTSVKALSETGSKAAYSEVKQALQDYKKYFE